MSRTMLAISMLACCACAHSEPTPPTPSGSGPVEMKASGIPGKVEATRSARVTAVVKAVDVSSRAVTLQTRSGETQTVKVGPNVQRLGEVAVGDTVDIYAEQDLTLEYQPPGSAVIQPTAMATGERGSPDRAPEGVVAAGIRATVVVTAIDLATRLVSFQGPGGVYQVKAGPGVKLEKLNVGDQLIATYVEAVAIQLAKTSGK